MALVLNTNVGFVSTAPTADPAGSDVVIDGSSVVVKDTAPAGAVKITEIGWYRGVGTNAANFEIALYSEAAGVAATRLFVDNTNSSTTQGWITVAVDWAITPGTAYWLAVQMDAHTGSSDIDSATSGGAGIDVRTSQSTLNDPYGGGAVSDADGMYAIYALYQKAPTVALNTPADAGAVSDPTPVLDFTGTDPEANDIRFNLQLDTANTFDSQIGSGPVHDTTVVGSANGSNSWTMPALSTGGTNRLVIVMTHTSNTSDAVPSSPNLTFVKIGSSFTFAGNGQMQVYRAFATAQLSSEVITITGTGFPQVTAVAATFSNTDSSGSSGSGAIGATNTHNSGSANASSAAVTTTRNNSLVIGCFAETANFLISAGTAQTQTGEATGVSFSRSEIEKQDSITANSSTSVTNNVGYGGTTAVGGMVIEILTAMGPLLDKVSGTDAGFANPDTGGDTDPFNSGENIQYTVQGGDSLDDDTYYWRVRGIDPTGSNTYGAWATTRSFILSSSAIKTIIGLAKASVKTVNGLAIASVKAINSLV